MHIKGRNVNDIFRTLTQGIFDGSIKTEVENSRVGEVAVIPEPVTITYSHPREKVLFNTARDTSPFFHVFETLHMLAGRRDIAPLAYYAENYRVQVQDGDSPWANGAYGYRWRSRRYAFGEPQLGPSSSLVVDQLRNIADHLKKIPHSRRAVLQMWNVEDDLLKIGPEPYSKDVCCLAGETRFRSPEGDTCIRDLVRKFQTKKGFKFPVYSVDTATGDQRLCWMTNAWKIGTKQIHKIFLDDGSFIRATGDHVVFRKKKRFDGKRCVGISVEECKVCDLSVGESLLSEMQQNAVTRVDANGYRIFKRNIYKNTSLDNLVYEHREYVSLFEPLKRYGGKDGHSIHHKNGNKLDNRIENLVQLDNYTHFSHDKFGQDNPHCKMSAEARVARGRKHAVAIKLRWASMSPELRSALITRKVNRTPEQWELVHEHNSAKSNHKIVAIERDGQVPVYDFTVPGRHNAVLDNGVIVHNCNLSALFSIETGDCKHCDGTGLKGLMVGGGTSSSAECQFCRGLSHEVPRYLNMTVFNRSNDLIWGALGANACHFSFLLEYMATRLGLEVGTYHQISNNLHVYTERWEPEKLLADATPDYYATAAAFGGNNPTLFPFVQDPDVFDEEVAKFIDCKPWTRNWNEPFLQRVATPMCEAFYHHKERRDYYTALKAAEGVPAEDWKIVCVAWLQRRQRNWEKKQHAKSTRDG